MPVVSPSDVLPEFDCDVLAWVEEEPPAASRFLKSWLLRFLNASLVARSLAIALYLAFLSGVDKYSLSLFFFC